MIPKAIGMIAVSSEVQKKGVSLDEQDRAIRERCERERWQLDEMIELPGVSRSDPNIIAIFTSAKPKHRPYQRLWELILSRKYQWLVCYDNGRIGRSMSMFTLIAENAIANGMKVCVITSGIIDEDNEGFAIPLGSMSATANEKRRVKMRRKAMEKRAADGLTQCRPLFSHLTIRDERGKTERLVVDESYRLFWLDLAELVLAENPRLSWREIADALATRGHINPGTRRPYLAENLLRIMRHPQVWGNSAMYAHGKPIGRWAYDPTAPRPAGLHIHYGKFESVYSGELGEQIKRELSRRTDEGQRHPPRGRKPFTGLLICATCGCSLTVGRPHVWRCRTGYIQRGWGGRPNLPTCPNSLAVKDDAIRDYLDDLLRQSHTRADLFNVASVGLLDQRLAALGKEAEKLDRKIANWLEELSADHPDRVKRLIRTSIEDAEQRRQELHDQSDALRSQMAEEGQDVAFRQQALDEIRANPDFWSEPAEVINRKLHDVCGPWRLVVRDGKIIGWGKSELRPGPRKA